jgi:hypothetical protein
MLSTARDRAYLAGVILVMLAMLALVQLVSF